MTRPKGRSRALAVTVVSGGLAAARGLGPWLERTVPRSVRGALTIKIVSDSEMARLNGDFRGKPVPTDVLSFPSGDFFSHRSRGPTPPRSRSAPLLRRGLRGEPGPTAAARSRSAPLLPRGLRGEPASRTALKRTVLERTASERTAFSRTSFRMNDLGDIAIARGVARRQAGALGHPLATELRVLALHGILHLLGYDHERDRGEMRAVEERWRRRARLPAGLVGRSERPPGSTSR